MTNNASSDDVSILSRLAEGIDPFTGEVLPDEHLLQHPQIVRALFHVIQALERQGRSTKRNLSIPVNAGTSWSKEEDATLIREFDANIPIAEIARRHSRSKGGITSRLVRLGKIVRREDAYAAKDA